MSDQNLTVKYDNLRQHVNITAKDIALDNTQNINLNDSLPPLSYDQIATPLKSLTLNYNLNGQQFESQRSASVMTDLHAWGYGPGSWSSSFNTRYDTQNEQSQFRTTRLMSSWQWDDMNKMRTVTVGDLYCGGLSWSRTVRLGGIKFARNFQLQPNFNTEARANWMGQASLPSTVDLYIDGFKQSSSDVQPGKFILNTVPTFSGAGQAQVVITDINGVRREVNLSLYGAPQMLRKGLNDWSVDLGWIRENYSVRSFDYSSKPIADGSLRYGLNDSLTGELHTEFADDLYNGGAGIWWLPGSSLGILHGSLAASQKDAQHGLQAEIGYQWTGEEINFSADHINRNPHFQDIASLSGSWMAKQSDNVWLSKSFESLGNWGIGWIRQVYQDNSINRYMNFSWSRVLWKETSMSVGYMHMLGDNNADSFYLSLSVPLGRHDMVSSQYGHDNHHNNGQLDYNHFADASGGWGWRISQQMGDSKQSSHAEINQQNKYGEWDIGLNRYNNINNYYGDASGSLLMLANNFHITRQSHQGYAIVSTDGIPDVPVSIENRPIGKTDKNGFLLLSEMINNQRNKISIDPLSLPASVHVPTTIKYAIPRGNNAVLADFGLHNQLSIVSHVKDTQGADLDMGSEVSLLDAEHHVLAKTIVGRNGLVYVENAPTAGELVINTRRGSCHAPLLTRVGQQGYVDNGEIVCR